MATRLGVLVSGRGSNLEALLDARRRGRLAADIALVASNVPSAKALDRAREAGVETAVLEPKAFPDREAFDAALRDLLLARGVELVCLAGFMRVLTPVFLRAFPRRVLNIHPGLLPSFPGLHAQRQAIAAGVRFAGCTVHFVDEGVDTGPILAQAVVSVRPDDDEAALCARILEEEHRLYPGAIDLVARGRVRIDGRRVVVDGARVAEGALHNPVVDPEPEPRP